MSPCHQRRRCAAGATVTSSSLRATRTPQHSGVALRRGRFVFELEADLLQTLERAFAELALYFARQARRVGNRIGLLVAFRHYHDEEAAGLAADIAEAEVLAARH